VGHEVEETAGFTPTVGHEVEETAGFTPTVGHEVEETAGFTPTVGHEVEETPGFTPTVGHEVEETPGFTPTQGHEVEETAGFTPTVGTRSKKHRDSRRPWVMKETPGLTPEKGKNGKKKKKGAGITPGQETESEAAAPGASPAQDAAEEKLKGRRPKKSKEEEVEDPVEKEKREREARKLASAEERAAKLKKAQEERRARLKKTQLEQKGIKQEEEEEPAEELELDDLMYQVSVDDLQQYLGISVIPDDRARLDRRWAMKVRDPSLRQLLADAKAMEHGYALIPRLPRYLKDGKIVQNNFVTIVRSFPQLFDNVAQIINKYKAEPFFVSEMPELDWAIVACEVLPESRNRSFMEQKTVVKQYAQKYRANDMRIQRRKLIEALYDVVMVNAITKENILKETVDLTATNVGRQNFACINFGEKGIHINDISRQQKHQQMGTCPAW